jgi:2-succinyl-6-hydroxy-2,4-cyclohexadiene-1-carboxylate synthase
MTPAPLALLHGFTGGPSSWDAVIDHLPVAQRTGIVRPALSGHAGAAPAPPGSRFEDEVDRIAALLGGEPPAHLAGYSLGARLALGLLVRHPARVSRATLIGVHPGLDSEAARAERRASDERWAAMLETEGVERFALAWSGQPLWRSQARLEPAVREAHRAERMASSAEGLARSLRTVGLGQMPSYWSSLAAIDRPVHLMAGALDDKFRALAERAVAALAQAQVTPQGSRSIASQQVHRVTVVPGAGHNLLLEAPAAVAAALVPA